jgi:hypothetical protein
VGEKGAGVLKRRMKPRSWDNDVLIEKNKQTSLNTKYEY